MRVLIDTRCWLWLNAEPERLPPKTLELLSRDDTERLLSVASIWEIAIKYTLDKLDLPEPPGRYVPSRLASTLTRAVPIDAEHALRAGALAVHHRDPFDRLIIAQALTERWRIVTVDPKFRAYGVRLV